MSEAGLRVPRSRQPCTPLPRSPRPLPSCLRGVTPPPERNHYWSHRYLPCLLRLDLLSPFWDARAAWQGTLKVPGPPTSQAGHASAQPVAPFRFPVTHFLLGTCQEIPFYSASGAEPGPEVVGMNALVRRCVARAGERPQGESCFHGNRVAGLRGSWVAFWGWSRSWSWSLQAGPQRGLAVCRDLYSRVQCMPPSGSEVGVKLVLS